MRHRRMWQAASAAAVAAIVLGAAGCGGGSKTTSGEPVSQWVDGVCSAASTWKTSLQDVATSLQGGSLSKSSLTDGVTQVQKANAAFASSLEALGKPNTQAGQQAKSILDQLATELQTASKSMHEAVAKASGVTGVLSAVSSVSASMSSVASDVSKAATQIQKLDPKGELEKAFKQSKSCKALTS